MFDSIDTIKSDGDPSISLEEFKKFMRKQSSQKNSKMLFTKLTIMKYILMYSENLQKVFKKVKKGEKNKGKYKDMPEEVQKLTLKVTSKAPDAPKADELPQ